MTTVLLCLLLLSFQAVNVSANGATTATTTTTTTTTTPTTVISIQGTIVNRQGNPLNGAVVQLWQTDANGVYNHPQSLSQQSDAALSADFQYFGTATADATMGKFGFRTIRPGSYSGRPTHYHFRVFAPATAVTGSGEGDVATTTAATTAVSANANTSTNNPTEEWLTSQWYFADELGITHNFNNERLLLNLTNHYAGVDGSNVVTTTIVVDVATNQDSAIVDEADLLQVTPSQTSGPFYPVVDFFQYDHDLTTLECDGVISTSTSTSTSLESSTTSMSSIPNNCFTAVPTDSSGAQHSSQFPTSIVPTTDVASSNMPISSPADNPMAPTISPGQTDAGIADSSNSSNNNNNNNKSSALALLVWTRLAAMIVAMPLLLSCCCLLLITN